MSKHELKPSSWWWAVVVLGLYALPGWAQWQWTDSSGRKVFSDTAPPLGVPDSAITRRPGDTRKAPPAATTPPAAGAAQPVANPAADKKNAELEAKKQQTEEAEKAKLKAEEARAAQARADNCQRAQRAFASLATESRVSTVNSKGERVIMDEALRSAEKARLQQIIQQSCKP